MIDFTDKTYANILANQLARVSNSIDKRGDSLIATALGPESYQFEAIYMDLVKMQNNAFALTASGESLDLKVAERSINRNPATAAVREGIFNIQVPIGSRYSTIDGANSVTFVVNSRMDSQVDGTPFDDAYFHYRMTCETLGTIGNGYSGNILPITFVQGLTLSQITTIILPGTDEEDDEALRQRYLLSLTEQAFGGNIASYRNYILSQSNIGAIQVYPAYKGGGTVLCSILDANFDPASNQLIEDIQYLVCPPESGDSTPSANGYGVAPIGAIADIGTATPLVINVTTTIQLSQGYSISTIQQRVEQAIQDYLLLVRRSWGNPVTTNEINYPVFVYISRINVAILAIEGVVNITDTTLNGSQSDIECTETGELQELPVMGTVTINAAS